MDKIEKYKKIYDYLADEITYIESMFDLYISLYNKRTTNLSQLNLAPAFFRLTTQAFLENSILRLCKLFDDDNKSISIYKLINYAEQNIQSEYPKLKLIKQKYQNIVDEDIKQKLKKLRDNLLAHNDKLNLDTDVWKQIGITIGEFHKIINSILEMLGDYSEIVEGQRTINRASNKNDIDDLFKHIYI
jgi:hypothetical protein